MPESYVCEWKELAWLCKFCSGYKYDWHGCEASVSEWYDTVSDEEIANLCILREMIEVREGRAIGDIFNIGEVDLFNNDLWIN